MRKVRSRQRQKKLPYLLILPSLIIIVGLFLFPIGYNVYLALHNWSSGFSNPRFFGLGNFKELLFYSSAFWNSIAVSLKFTFISVAIEFVLGLGIALLFEAVTKGRKLFRVLIVIPMAITPIVSSLTWKTLIYDTTFGILNYLLASVGLNELEWLGKSDLALLCVIAMEVWHWTPFLVIIFIAGLSSLPSESFEAAAVDGATSWQVFRFVTFPLLVPVTFIGVIFRTIDAFRTFDVIYALTGGGPGTVTQAMPLFIFQTSFEYFHIGEAAAAAFMIVILAFIIVTMLFSAYRYLRKDISE